MCVVKASLVAALVAALAYMLATNPFGNVPPSLPSDSAMSALPSWPAYRASNALASVLGATAAATTPPSARAWAIITAFMQSEILATLLAHDVFDNIFPEGSTSAQAAIELGLHEPTLRRYLAAAETLGLVKHGRSTDRFFLTEAGKTLRSDAPSSLRPIALFMHGGATKAAWRAATSRSIVTGESGWMLAHGQDIWHYLAEHPEEEALFGQAMTGLTRPMSGAIVADLKPPTSVGGRNATFCDIGGGVGTLLSEWLRHHPHARGFLLEQPAVVERAKEYLASRGVAGRSTVASGSFFEKLPANMGAACDVFVIKHCLHNWADEPAAAILAHIREGSKKKHAILVAIEAVLMPGASAVLELPKRLMDINMATTVSHGARERTMADFAALFKSAGLPAPTRQTLRLPSVSLLTAPLHAA
ncbi:hypothetical protein KFE25_007419 [Diacronema lutheri]|uniref:O-methyltransferase C-terminal domain-containing protein n=1 Tax=Diacronema lutheri TaxID=2081491 RepID=A0A8J5XTY3_DIALT|nr:hypothetical protein KFE25_007419 [Diacronema lutheri]